MLLGKLVFYFTRVVNIYSPLNNHFHINFHWAVLELIVSFAFEQGSVLLTFPCFCTADLMSIINKNAMFIGFCYTIAKYMLPMAPFVISTIL